MPKADYILAEFKGTYRAPHPDGIRDQSITKPFHVKVKMKREALKAPGMCGLFRVYYFEHLRKAYPDIQDTYNYELVQATELNGDVIDNPKALSYDGLLAYIKEKEYPINTLLYSPVELRNEVVLYEEDPKGQQFLQEKRLKVHGNAMKMAADLTEVDDLLVVVGAEPAKTPAAPVFGNSKK